MMPAMSARIDSNPGGSITSVVVAQASELVVEPIELVVVAALPLDTVAQVARGQDERDDQHHGVEVVAHQADEPEAPDRRERAGQNRRPPAAALTEAEVKDDQHQHDRSRKMILMSREIVVAPSRDHRLAGDIDLGVVVGYLWTMAWMSSNSAVVDVAAR